MWVLLAVTVGGGLFGVVGMLTAVPITSIVYTLLGEITGERLRTRGIAPADYAPPAGEPTPQDAGKGKHK